MTVSNGNIKLLTILFNMVSEFGTAVYRIAKFWSNREIIDDYRT